MEMIKLGVHPEMKSCEGRTFKARRRKIRNDCSITLIIFIIYKININVSMIYNFRVLIL